MLCGHSRPMGEEHVRAFVCCGVAQMMKQAINLVFSCTDREALNLAIFLNETFILLERWRVRTQICCLFKNPQRDPS